MTKPLFKMGQHVRDRISQTSGIIYGIQHHFTGMIRYEMQPVGADKDGKMKDPSIADEIILELDSSQPDVAPPVLEERKPKFELLSTLRSKFVPAFQGVATVYIETMNGCIYYNVQPNAMHEGRPVLSKTDLEESFELVEVAKEKVPEKAAGGPRTERTNRR